MADKNNTANTYFDDLYSWELILAYMLKMYCYGDNQKNFGDNKKKKKIFYSNQKELYHKKVQENTANCSYLRKIEKHIKSLNYYEILSTLHTWIKLRFLYTNEVLRFLYTNEVLRFLYNNLGTQRMKS